MGSRRLTVEGDESVPASWGVIPGMGGDDLRMTAAEWGQQEYDKGLARGRTDGINTAATAILARAAAAFSAGKDADAVLLRALAEEIRTQVK